MRRRLLLSLAQDLAGSHSRRNALASLSRPPLQDAIPEAVAPRFSFFGEEAVMRGDWCNADPSITAR